MNSKPSNRDGYGGGQLGRVRQTCPRTVSPTRLGSGMATPAGTASVVPPTAVGGPRTVTRHHVSGQSATTVPKPVPNSPSYHTSPTRFCGTGLQIVRATTRRV